MIKNISIQGYKSIKELKDFELKPLNVLIGPNRGGKSNFLDFFSFMSDAVRTKLIDAIKYRGGFSPLVWAGNLLPEIKTEISVERPHFDTQTEQLFEQPDAIDYKLSISRTSMVEEFLVKESIDSESIKPLQYARANLWAAIVNDQDFSLPTLAISRPAEFAIQNMQSAKYLNYFFNRIRYYHGFDTSYDSPMMRSSLLVSGAEFDNFCLEPNGDNLSIVYYHLFNSQIAREAKQEIMYILTSVFPDLVEIRFAPDIGQGRVSLVWTGTQFEKDMYPQQLSNGTLNFMCLLAILLNPVPSTIVCIDEPENGLHPEMLDILAEIMLQASKRMQVFVATHSPRLVRNLKPENIIVVENKAGQSKFTPQDPERLEKWLKSFDLGKLWEMGEIGGRL